MQRIKPEPDNPQQALIPALSLRRLCAGLYPDLAQDPGLEQLTARLDRSLPVPEELTGMTGRSRALAAMLCRNALIRELREYLQEHPRAAVVNMGCGLEQLGEICDNGQCRIYNVDMPEYISLRNRLLPPGSRVQNIECDLNNPIWFGDVDASQGVVFAAYGIFYSLRKNDVPLLISRMAQYFPGGRLVFDTGGRKLMQRLARPGTRHPEACFYVENVKRDLESRLRNIRLTLCSYSGGQKLPGISQEQWLLSRLESSRLRLLLLRLDF